MKINKPENTITNCLPFRSSACTKCSYNYTYFTSRTKHQLLTLHHGLIFYSYPVNCTAKPMRSYFNEHGVNSASSYYVLYDLLLINNNTFCEARDCSSPKNEARLLIRIKPYCRATSVIVQRIYSHEKSLNFRE